MTKGNYYFFKNYNAYRRSILVLFINKIYSMQLKLCNICLYSIASKFPNSIQIIQRQYVSTISYGGQNIINQKHSKA